MHSNSTVNDWFFLESIADSNAENITSIWGKKQKHGWPMDKRSSKMNMKYVEDYDINPKGLLDYVRS